MQNKSSPTGSEVTSGGAANHVLINDIDVITSKVESIALYGAPLIFNENEAQKKRQENILMKVNKWIYGPGTFKLNYKKLCNSIKVDPPDQKILKINTQYIAKIFYEKEVEQILEMLKINNRVGSKVYFNKTRGLRS